MFWTVAFAVGLVGGFAAVLFRFSVSSLQEVFYQTDEITLVSKIHYIPWAWLLLLPVLGGLSVGLILHYFLGEDRNGSVSDVIEGATLNNGRVSLKFGLVSTLVSLVTLTTGGSTGREGPVVHLAAVISTWISNFMNVEDISARDLLGCAVAAAVSASFNAPIAGTLFALEVILRHFAIHAFAPIAIASVAGTIIGRFFYGNVTEFTLGNETTFAFYSELPAFMILGLVCGLVSVVFIKTIFLIDDFTSKVQHKNNIPIWLRPTVAGFFLGIIAIKFPHIIGVGYETTSNALTGQFELKTIIIFAIIKVVAVVVTMAGRMGGGIFSPSLMLGALTGLGFGLLATSIFPTASGSETLYALAGMGAVAAAVLGAPISTTLIVFELTGNWQVGLAVMAAVSTSTALTSKFVDKSFFLNQLTRRNLNLISGPQFYLLRNKSVGNVMKKNHSDLIDHKVFEKDIFKKIDSIELDNSLELALHIFEQDNVDYLFVVRPESEKTISDVIGVLYYLDVLKIYTEVLIKNSQEEHS